MRTIEDVNKFLESLLNLLNKIEEFEKLMLSLIERVERLEITVSVLEENWKNQI